MPPPLPGLSETASRLITIPAGRESDAGTIAIHVLDSATKGGGSATNPRETNPSEVPIELTVLCVHGNPTWSYLWRRFVDSAPPKVRVIAPDHVGMGFSERSGGVRRLRQRIEDLGAIVDALEVSGPVVVIAHDWGGPIALGWVQEVLSSTDVDLRIAGVVLTNTAVHQPEHRRSPALIAAARMPSMIGAVTHRTSLFVRATTAISRVDPATARAFGAPYRQAATRSAIKDFVADIPLEKNHPSRATLDLIAERMNLLRQTPVLLVWGMRDPVFSVRYLDDLRRRLPGAEVQQFEDAGHLVLEDRPDAINGMWTWIESVVSTAPRNGSSEPSSRRDPVDLAQELKRRGESTPTLVALSEPMRTGFRDVTWGRLVERVDQLARSFAQRGIGSGDRVAVLVAPGADLLAVVNALWSLGASIVVIDAAHGVRSLWRSLRAARLDHVIAMRHAAPVVRALRVPGEIVWSEQLGSMVADSIGLGSARNSMPEVDLTETLDAAVLFTSGATGPAKPVCYSREGIAATRDVLQRHYQFTDDDVLVAAFAPWAILGPLLGISSVVPQMDPSRPGSLTAESLADACHHGGGTVMWMSPAALRSVLSGADADPDVKRRLMDTGRPMRLLLLAGAPVSAELLQRAHDVWPNADIRTPYGMTEVLPVTDVSGQEILAEPSARGVLVGVPLEGVDVAIAELNHDGEPAASLTVEPGVLGEVAIRAAHAKERYDARAFIEQRSSRNVGWHRTGDVGLLDDKGRLWIEGRLGHVITTSDGPRGAVSIEQTVEAALEDTIVAAVGVGPVGAQVVVIVCASASPVRRRGARRQGDVRLAPVALAEKVRSIALSGQNRSMTHPLPPIAAVLEVDRMPVDIRHGAKIDRTRLADQASRFLAGAVDVG